MNSTSHVLARLIRQSDQRPMQIPVLGRPTKEGHPPPRAFGDQVAGWVSRAGGQCPGSAGLAGRTRLGLAGLVPPVFRGTSRFRDVVWVIACRLVDVLLFFSGVGFYFLRSICVFFFHWKKYVAVVLEARPRFGAFPR